MTKIALTIPEAVELSGIGRTKLYELFKRGELRPRKAGSKTLILFDELEAYVRSLPVTA